jgi:hypothetical protein
MRIDADLSELVELKSEIISTPLLEKGVLEAIL